MRLATSNESCDKAIKKFAPVAAEWVNLPGFSYCVTQPPLPRTLFVNAAEAVIFSNEL
jgi:hypothetical protein